MHRPRRIATLGAAVGFAALGLTAAPVHAAGVPCGTVDADYIGHTYYIAGFVPFGGVTFQKGGITTFKAAYGGPFPSDPLPNGTFHASGANLTFTSGTDNTWVATTRDCANGSGMPVDFWTGPAYFFALKS